MLVEVVLVEVKLTSGLFMLEYGDGDAIRGLEIVGMALRDLLLVMPSRFEAEDIQFLRLLMLSLV
jgi:hypothetical protein